jgi:hypothetical protein
MPSSIATTLMVILAMSLPVLRAADVAVNAAKDRAVTTDSVKSERYSGGNAVDGDAADGSRWVSANVAGPHWLAIDLGSARTLMGAHLYAGEQNTTAPRNFEFQSWDGQQWVTIPGSKRKGYFESELAIAFDKPVTTGKLRLWIEQAPDPETEGFWYQDHLTARVNEVLLWEGTGQGMPPLGTGLRPQAFKEHPVFVNQIGYNLDRPKRFTAPLLDQGTFTISMVGSDEVLYAGAVRNGLGDFSDFRPEHYYREFIVTVRGGSLAPGRSDPFSIAPFLMQRSCLLPALQFWIDDRAVTGSVPMAFGACPWRDGPYYNFDTQSLVMMYLANPSFFEHAPVEMDWARDRERILDPGFVLERPRDGNGIWDCDENALEIARKYYAELDAPIGRRVPDIIQCIHWGVGWWRLKPASSDYAADPAGHRVHPETISSFSFFLYAYPFMKRYFTERYYRDIRDFAIAQWKSSGLFEVNTTIGTFKGRDCPGYSILPNLLMHEVARRDGLREAEAFLTAAQAQADWVVKDLDFNDPRVTKGQRMSEHKLMMGLVTFLRLHPDRAPAGLREKLGEWARIMIGRSQNMWDFRRYDDRNWALPLQAEGNPLLAGSAGWNEPGNLAGFPALAFSVADLLEDQDQARRLREIGAGQFDAVFGRNPVGSASPWRMPSDYPGVERGWPRHFRAGFGAELETVRGALNSSASTEQYPFNPVPAFRHPEGWSAFNSAFNVALAVSCQSESSVELLDARTRMPVEVVRYGQPLEIRLRAPLGPGGLAVPLRWETDGGGQGTVVLRPLASKPWEALTTVSVMESGEPGQDRLVVPRGGRLTISHGFGFMRRSASCPVEGR